MTLEQHPLVPSRRQGGLDGRSRSARRLKRLVASYTSALGGGSNLTELQRQDIVRTAKLALVAEDLADRRLAGEAVDPDLICRTDSTARRARAAIGLREPSEVAAEASLRRFMLNKYGEDSE
jgi:hypothetical protein